MSERKTPRAGSLTFGTTTMRTEDVVLYAKCAMSEGIAKEDVMAYVQATDDMLSIGRMSPIIISQSRTQTGRLRKNSTYRSMLERRIEQLVSELKQTEQENDRP
jgi:hypothetical protein